MDQSSTTPSQNEWRSSSQQNSTALHHGSYSQVYICSRYLVHCNTHITKLVTWNRIYGSHSPTYFSTTPCCPIYHWSYEHFCQRYHRRHANLLPIPLLLDKIQFHAASRLATLPSSHPLYPIIRRANRHYVRHHRAPIHHLLHRSGIPALLPLETISPMRRRPNFTPDLTVDIPPDKHSAIAQAKLY